MSDNLTPSMRRAMEAKGRQVELGEDAPRTVPGLSAELRKARIDLAIKDRQIAALRACLRGEHEFPFAKASGGCFVCGKLPGVQ